MSRPMLRFRQCLSAGAPRPIRSAPKPAHVFFCLRQNSSASAAPGPLLPRLRALLKTAMQTKSTAQLSVLRSLLAEITNASKTPSPVSSDLALLSILRKRIAGSKAAIEEFRAAGREDLARKEQDQLDVLEGYVTEITQAAGGETTEEQIREIVQKAVEAIQTDGGKPDMGAVMKKALGELEGKLVEKSQVAKAVKEVLSK